MIGGILREYRDRGVIQDLRDIDIIIDVKNIDCWEEILKKYCPKRNSFGGYKLICSELIVDIWLLEETWAYREKYIVCGPEEYVQNLPETVFLNIDAIIYDLKRDIWYDEKYQEAMNCKIIDVVLEKNPQILLNIVRAMVLKKKYEMSFSERFTEIIRNQMEKNPNFVEELLEIQKARYQKTILSRDEIETELSDLL